MGQRIGWMASEGSWLAEHAIGMPDAPRLTLGESPSTDVDVVVVCGTDDRVRAAIEVVLQHGCRVAWMGDPNAVTSDGWLHCAATAAYAVPEITGAPSARDALLWIPSIPATLACLALHPLAEVLAADEQVDVVTSGRFRAPPEGLEDEVCDLLAAQGVVPELSWATGLFDEAEWVLSARSSHAALGSHPQLLMTRAYGASGGVTGGIRWVVREQGDKVSFEFRAPVGPETTLERLHHVLDLWHKE